MSSKSNKSNKTAVKNSAKNPATKYLVVDLEESANNLVVNSLDDVIAYLNERAGIEGLDSDAVEQYYVVYEIVREIPFTAKSQSKISIAFE